MLLNVQFLLKTTVARSLRCSWRSVKFRSKKNILLEDNKSENADEEDETSVGDLKFCPARPTTSLLKE